MARAVQTLLVLAATCLLVLHVAAQTTDRYTDENRPYEFGFNIEGQQHRHEKKDESGIITGEFGFITADGIYHVTVYATDENGDFKIISMKNIRVGPSPWGNPSTKTTPAPGVGGSLGFRASPVSTATTASTPSYKSYNTASTRSPALHQGSTRASIYQAGSTQPAIYQTTSAPINNSPITTTKKILNGHNGCGSCLIPTTTTTTRSPPPLSVFPSPGFHQQGNNPSFPGLNPSRPTGIFTPTGPFNNQYPGNNPTQNTVFGGSKPGGITPQNNVGPSTSQIRAGPFNNQNIGRNSTQNTVFGTSKPSSGTPQNNLGPSTSQIPTGPFNSQYHPGINPTQNTVFGGSKPNGITPQNNVGPSTSQIPVGPFNNQNVGRNLIQNTVFGTSKPSSGTPQNNLGPSTSQIPTGPFNSQFPGINPTQSIGFGSSRPGSITPQKNAGPSSSQIPGLQPGSSSFNAGKPSSNLRPPVGPTVTGLPQLLPGGRTLGTSELTQGGIPSRPSSSPGAFSPQTPSTIHSSDITSGHSPGINSLPGSPPFQTPHYKAPGNTGSQTPIYKTPGNSSPQTPIYTAPGFNSPGNSFPQTSSYNSHPQTSFNSGNTPSQTPSYNTSPNTGSKPSIPQMHLMSPTPPGPIGVVRDGPPPGVSVSDVKDILYRFNYTAGFHGHHESGYRSGDKQGGYFVHGRDGISRQVKYVANEFGYQPNITLVDLGLKSPDTPQEDTEKQYGLKGFEFIWFPLS